METIAYSIPDTARLMRLIIQKFKFKIDTGPIGALSARVYVSHTNVLIPNNGTAAPS